MIKFELLELDEEFRQYWGEPKAQKLLNADTLLEPLKNLRLNNSVLVCAEETDSVAEAAARMGEKRIGCTIVVRNGKVTGICSERDIIQEVLCARADPSAVQVGEIMTPDPECLQPDDAVAFALHLMDVGGYRHIPLVNDEYEPVGIVSVKDIVEHIVVHFPAEVYNLPPQPLRRGWGSSREGA